MHQRATADATWMKQRRELAEHPFGTMKWMMGHPRFLERFEKAKGELAYNLKRVIQILGVPALLAAQQVATILRRQGRFYRRPLSCSNALWLH
jgi:hypothetical protein